MAEGNVTHAAFPYDGAAERERGSRELMEAPARVMERTMA